MEGMLRNCASGWKDNYVPVLLDMRLSKFGVPACPSSAMLDVPVQVRRSSSSALKFGAQVRRILPNVQTAGLRVLEMCNGRITKNPREILTGSIFSLSEPFFLSADFLQIVQVIPSPTPG